MRVRVNADIDLTIYGNLYEILDSDYNLEDYVADNIELSFIDGDILGCMVLDAYTL